VNDRDTPVEKRRTSPPTPDTSAALADTTPLHSSASRGHSRGLIPYLLLGLFLAAAAVLVLLLR
jgi:hypothetical protein